MLNGAIGNDRQHNFEVIENHIAKGNFMSSKGRLIVFEGGEGAGKTSQIQATAVWLHTQIAPDLPILTTREPGGTALGQALRHLLLHGEAMSDRAELLLFAADRAEHVSQCLRPALAQGAIVLCDRYTDSTLAYQHYGRGLDLAMIEQLNAIATGGLTSDVTFWLDVAVKTGLERSQQRGKRDRMEQADLAFHQRVRDGFAQLAQDNPTRIVAIDANRDPGAIQQEIQAVLLARQLV